MENENSIIVFGIILMVVLLVAFVLSLWLDIYRNRLLIGSFVYFRHGHTWKLGLLHSTDGYTCDILYEADDQVTARHITCINNLYPVTFKNILWLF